MEASRRRTPARIAASGMRIQRFVPDSHLMVRHRMPNGVAYTPARKMEYNVDASHGIGHVGFRANISAHNLEFRATTFVAMRQIFKSADRKVIQDAYVATSKRVNKVAILMMWFKAWAWSLLRLHRLGSRIVCTKMTRPMALFGLCTDLMTLFYGARYGDKRATTILSLNI